MSRLYDAFVNLLDVEDPISEEEDDTVPDLSEGKDFEDDTTMQNDAAK